MTDGNPGKSHTRLRRTVLIVALGAATTLGYLLLIPIVAAVRSTTRELARVTSPDGDVDAVLDEIRPGFVTEPYFYRVYIVRAGSHEFKDEDEVVEATGLGAAKMAWVVPRLLEIPYSNACINKFSNNWSHMSDDRYVVEIRLIPPADNSPHSCD